MTVSGVEPIDEAALRHNALTEIQLRGEAIEAGDWVVFIRADRYVDCAAAFASSLSTAGAVDHGGLVYDSGGGQLRVLVQLHGGEDGITDPNPHDEVQEIDEST